MYYRLSPWESCSLVTGPGFTPTIQSAECYLHSAPNIQDPIKMQVGESVVVTRVCNLAISMTTGGGVTSASYQLVSAVQWRDRTQTAAAMTKGSKHCWLLTLAQNTEADIHSALSMSQFRIVALTTQPKRGPSMKYVAWGAGVVLLITINLKWKLQPAISFT